MFEINKEIISQCCKCLSGCIEKLLLFNIVFRFNPLALEHFPNGFCNIQMQGIRRQIEQEEFSLFPKRYVFPNAFVTIYTNIAKHKKSLFVYLKREIFQKLHDSVYVYIFLCAKLETFIWFHHSDIQAPKTAGLRD